MEPVVKQELTEAPHIDLPIKIERAQTPKTVSVIDLSSSDSDDDSEFLRKRSGVFNGSDSNTFKKMRFEDLGAVLPLDFLDPLPPEEPFPLPAPALMPVDPPVLPPPQVQSCRQFWKAGDYEGDSQSIKTETVTGGLDHVRVHPRFLHSNATSHKWALGAFAELLDNSLDEVCHGATYANIDMLCNKKDGTRMLLIEDNGGGMDPDKMRQCMSLGYSAKSKMANTIGQYGNGFKTSTMRLGADVIVFSRCRGADGKRSTQSIGMLSYTFLRGTGKEDIVVPMLDYEKGGRSWDPLIRSSPVDWKRNVEAIVDWSPYSSEVDILDQFSNMKGQGTRIIIYNLWEDDEGELELDFDTQPHDIQIRGVNREEKNIKMAKNFPNSWHFLTYRHSLRSYASILYLRLPRGFKMILRGKDIEHHNTVDDMMLTQEITYRPAGGNGAPKDSSMIAVVKIGFVKDAKDHIDVQGFNVYHKNRLIKPFWRVWNAAGSDGRGVIGVLEANFVEPAHDKQGFERTTVLQRLETKLVQMQKTYWSTNCHKIGYAPRVYKKQFNGSTPAKETPASKKAVSPSNVTPRISSSPDPPYHPDTDKRQTHSNLKHIERRDALHVASSVPADDTRVYGHASIGAGLDSRNVIKRSEKKITSSPLVNGQASISAGLDSKNIIKRSEKKMSSSPHVNGRASVSPGLGSKNIIERSEKITSSSLQCLLNESSHEIQYNESSHEIQYNTQSSPDLDDAQLDVSGEGSDQICTREQAKTIMEEHDISANEPGPSESGSYSLKQLVQENQERKDRLKNLEETLEFERDKVKSLEAQLLEAEQKLEAASSEQEALIDIFSEERNRRDKEEEILRKKLKDASTTIQELIEKQRSTL